MPYLWEKELHTKNHFFISCEAYAYISGVKNPKQQLGDSFLGTMVVRMLWAKGNIQISEMEILLAPKAGKR